ncbi:MAG: PKD domain-containing protein [Balneola sp.]|nr:MAG: PKD domain-containing protein [Balneola sp.]
MFKRITLVIAFFVSGFSGYSQEMYLSISGQNVDIQSGDNRHLYDIWIKPGANAQNGSLQIFDAGLGGAVDLITQEDANTVTTFELFRFDELYRTTGNSVATLSGSPTAQNSLVTKSEERFKNRWVPLADISPGPNGYIVRVTTDEGDDVNSFNFRVVSPTGQVLSGSAWKVVAIDLSVGVYRSSANTLFQLKPHILDPGADAPNLSINGQEDSRITIIDAFGETYPVADSDMPSQRFGIDNNWGLQIGGSQSWLNTLTVFGQQEPVLWEFEPIALNELEKPSLSINEIEATRCTNKRFELSGNVFTQRDLGSAQWILNSEVISTGSGPTIAFEDRGQIPVDVLIPNERSYFPEYWAYTKIVFVNTPPIARLESPKEIISPSEVLTLSAAESYDLEGQEVDITWFVNGTRRNTGPSFDFSNTVSGLYTISIQVADGGTSLNCSISEQEVQVRVNTQPYAEIDVAPVSGTDDEIVLKVSNQTDSDNDQLTYLWAGIGIPQNSTAESIVVQHQQPGVYPVRLTVNDGSGAQNAAYSVNQVYEVNAAPVPEFSVPGYVAPGDIFALNGVESEDPNQDPLIYIWTVNDEEVARGDVSTLSLSNPGDYEIKLTVDDQRGVSNSVQSLTQVVHVNAPPSPIITAVPITSTAKVTFAATQSSDAESELASYDWDFGDGNRASGPQVDHTYQRTGSYTVRLTVDDGSNLRNSVQTSEHVIVVNSYPVASFEIPEVVAPGIAFTADASTSTDADGAISKYEWEANGSAAGIGRTNTITLTESGLHTISLYVTDDSGFDQAKGFSSKQVRVNQPPIPGWRTEPTEIVPNTEIKFFADQSVDPDGNIDSYLWRFEDGTELKGMQIQRIFSEGGIKRFTITVTDNDGLENSTSTVEGFVNVNHQPYIVTETVVRSNSTTVRLDASESYDLDNDAITYEWTLPDGTKRKESSFSWTAPSPGIHFIGLTLDDGLGLSNSVNSESIRVMVNRPVQAVVDSVITSCSGQTVLFNSSRSFDPDGDAFRAQWDFGNGVTSDEANPSYVYETPGVYEAKLTLSDGFSGQSSVAKIPVIIEGSPVAKLNLAEATICVNTALMFDGSESTDPSGSLPAMSWDMGDGNSATGARFEHIFTEPGEYTVTLTVVGSGSGQCSNISQATAKVTVVEGPVASFDLPEWIAPGEPIILDGSASSADGGFRTAKWMIDTESGSQELDGLTTTHTFNEPGEYFVTLYLETNTDTDCNTVSLTKSIKVNAPPTIVWELPDNIVAGEDLELNAFASSDPDGFIKQFKWYIDDGFVSYNASELVKAITPGRHKVNLEIRDNSAASNNVVTMEKYFFANSSPLPTIEGPAIIYQNQQVNLRSGLGQDRDGDLLTTTWKLDGQALPFPQFTVDEPRTYRVTLIQNDGRGLPNSADSTILEINPVRVPDVSPSYPEKIVVGGVLSIPTMGVSDSWTFANQNFYETSWRASAAGEQTFHLAWTPLGMELSRRPFTINVVEPLKFTEPATPLIVDWNPVNPTTVVKIPALNRPLSEVQIIWKQAGEEIGRGSQLSPRLIRGQNRFTVEVSDLKVSQSRPISVDVIVTTQ